MNICLPMWCRCLLMVVFASKEKKSYRFILICCKVDSRCSSEARKVCISNQSSFNSRHVNNENKNEANQKDR